ncbi:MAG: phasin family protein [Bilifractor sp.]|jgi:polyhydroxyalkanoate synthesis regulator phasin
MADNFDFMDIFKTGFLAGVGAVTMGAEKSKEIVDKFVEKGKITVEQGKALNQELKHKVDDAVAESKDKAQQSKKTVETAKAAGEAVKSNDFAEFLSHLTPEQMASLKAAIEKSGEPKTGDAEPKAEEAEPAETPEEN